MAETTNPSPPTPSHPRRRLLRVFLSFLLALAATAIIAGSLRFPAPPAAGGGIMPYNLPTAAVVPSTSARATVATYNIHSGVGTDGKFDLNRTAAELKSYGLVGLNEVRGRTPFSRTDQAEILGHSVNLPWLFAPSERQWGMDAFGNAVLSCFPIRFWQRIPLPGDSRRNVLLLRVSMSDPDTNILITHIDRGADREPQLRAVIELFLSLSEPAILMGDMNTPASDPLLQRLRSTSGVDDPLTRLMGDKLPSTNIDWIFLRGLRAVDAGLKDSPASDHPIAWAKLWDLANPPPKAPMNRSPPSSRPTPAIGD